LKCENKTIQKGLKPVSTGSIKNIACVGQKINKLEQKKLLITAEKRISSSFIVSPFATKIKHKTTDKTVVTIKYKT